jgi:hypothetical protein
MICMPREQKNSSHAASIQRFVTIVFPLPPRLGRFLWFGAGETLSVGRLATFAGRSTWLLRSSGKLVGKDSSFDSMESTGLQFFRNQIFIARVSTGDEQTVRAHFAQPRVLFRIFCSPTSFGELDY